MIGQTRVNVNHFPAESATVKAALARTGTLFAVLAVSVRFDFSEITLHPG
jgi:hypothetical protein